MTMEEFWVELLLGAFLLFTSFQIGWKENLHLIHSYHYRNVAPEDLSQFARKLGLAGLIVGVGIMLMPIMNRLADFELGYYLGLAAIVIGIILMLYTIIKYNGSIFGLRRKK